MLHGELLDKLDKIGRHFREPHLPFGGIQVILCGDFLQLPPVRKGAKVSFAFDSHVWDKLFPRANMITLKNVFRQSDSRFVDCLESIRRGKVTDAHDELLRSLSRPLDNADGIQAVLL
jgi:ATP-dependent DNA helicase PIF1